MRINAGTYFTTNAAAKFLRDRGFRTTPSTLLTLRCRGTGPAFIKVGYTPIYAEKDLLAWLATRRCLSRFVREAAT